MGAFAMLKRFAIRSLALIGISIAIGIFKGVMNYILEYLNNTFGIEISNKEINLTIGDTDRRANDYNDHSSFSRKKKHRYNVDDTYEQEEMQDCSSRKKRRGRKLRKKEYEYIEEYDDIDEVEEEVDFLDTYYPNFSCPRNEDDLQLAYDSPDLDSLLVFAIWNIWDNAKFRDVIGRHKSIHHYMATCERVVLRKEEFEKTEVWYLGDNICVTIEFVKDFRYGYNGSFVWRTKSVYDIEVHREGEPEYKGQPKYIPIRDIVEAYYNGDVKF